MKLLFLRHKLEDADIALVDFAGCAVLEHLSNVLADLGMGLVGLEKASEAAIGGRPVGQLYVLSGELVVNPDSAGRGGERSVGHRGIIGYRISVYQ